MYHWYPALDPVKVAMNWPDLFALLKVSLILKGAIKVWVEVYPHLR